MVVKHLQKHHAQHGPRNGCQLAQGRPGFLASSFPVSGLKDCPITGFNGKRTLYFYDIRGDPYLGSPLGHTHTVVPLKALI